MPSCPKCGFEIKGQKFCIKCGTKVSAITAEVSAQIDIQKKRIEKDPLAAYLYFDLGSIYEQNAMLDEALLEYQKGLNIDKSNWEAHLKSGNLYLELKQPSKAETSFEKSLVVNSSNLETRMGLLRAYHLQGKLDNAIRLGKETLQLNPNNIECLKELKELHAAKGNLTEKIQCLEVLSSILPKDIRTLKELAQSYEETDEDEKALRYYRKILELNSHDENASYHVAKHECIRGDYPKGIQLLPQIIDNLPESLQSNAHLLLAYANANLNNLNQALEEISQVSALYDSDLSEEDKRIYAETFHKIGQVFLDRKDPDSALHYFKVAAKYKPENSTYQLSYNKISENLSRTQTKTRRRRIGVATVIALVAVTIAVYYYITHGKIQVDVSPLQSAKIYLDGQESNVFKPIKPGIFESATLDWGTYNVSVVADRFEKWEGVASVGWNRTSFLKATLAPTLGSIEVLSEPSDAELYVNSSRPGDWSKGTTPRTLKDLQIGKYTLIVNKEFYYSDTVTFELTKGKNQPILFKLKRGRGEVVIDCDFSYCKCGNGKYRIGNQVQECLSWIDGHRAYFALDAGPVELFYNVQGKWESTNFVLGVDETVRFWAGYVPSLGYGYKDYYYFKRGK